MAKRSAIAWKGKNEEKIMVNRFEAWGGKKLMIGFSSIFSSKRSNNLDFQSNEVYAWTIAYITVRDILAH